MVKKDLLLLSLISNDSNDGKHHRFGNRVLVIHVDTQTHSCSIVRSIFSSVNNYFTSKPKMKK